MLETELKELALKEGSIRAGIARREAFSEAPPSADMRYLKPWANTVVSFAISKGTDWIEDYLGKVTRMVIRDNMHFVYHETYRIANVLASRLKGAGLEVRKKWMELLFNSGVVELDEEGREVVVKLDEQGNRTDRTAVSEVD